MRRKRILCLFLALLTLAALLALPASGLTEPVFVAVNDTIPQTLSGNELPFYSGGTLYVPYTVFSRSSMGFYPSYTPESNTLTLFSRNQRLVYDLSADLVTDENGQIEYVPTVVRSGTVFVPAVYSANHFGVQVATLTSRGGYTVIRFTTGTQVYDDSLFIEKAENLISYLLEQYAAATQPEVDEPTPPTTPSEPSVAPDPDEPEQTPAQIYLAVVDAAAMEQSLELLAQANLSAVFFLTAEEIDANGDLVRRIAAEGHGLGVTTSTEGDVAEELRLANEALDRALGRKTLMALVPEDADRTAVENAYRVFVRPSIRLTASEAAEAYGESRLLIVDGALLSAGLPILEEAGATFAPLRETSELP